MTESHLFEAEGLFITCVTNKPSSGPCIKEKVTVTLKSAEHSLLSIGSIWKFKEKESDLSGHLGRAGSATTSCYMWLYTAQLAI